MFAKATRFGDVVAVDRVRRAAAHAFVPTINDGSLGGRAPAVGFVQSEPIGALAPGFRLVDARATADSQLLQSLVFPLVGSLKRGASSATSREGARVLPTGLDVVAWLGSGEARAAEHASGDDAYDRYDEILARHIHARPPEGTSERHGTPYASMLDAISTWLAPSSGDGVQPGARTVEWRERKTEVALSAWTELRHDASAMAHGTAVSPAALQRVSVERAAAVFVEPHPEAIAKLIALVRQTSRALLAEGALTPGTPTLTSLDEVGDLLSTAFTVALQEIADRPLSPAALASMEAFPSRLSALEAALADAGEADVPLAIDVHTDEGSARTLEECLGRVEEAWIAVREPGTHRLWLAIGASIPHHETVQPASQRLTDDAWRSRLQTAGDPTPDSLGRGYRVEAM